MRRICIQCTRNTRRVMSLFIVQTLVAASIEMGKGVHTRIDKENLLGKGVHIQIDKENLWLLNTVM